MYGQRRAGDALSEYPLVAGALAFAAGAAVAALLPRTRMEDRAVGTYSDRLMAEAERIFAEEKSRAASALRAAADEAGKVARDAVADVKRDVKEGAERVADRASDASTRH